MIELELSLSTIELKNQYAELDESYQKAFIIYLADEFNAIDDEFSSIVSYVLFALKSNKDLEIEIDKISNTFPKTNILLVVQAILDYLNQSQND